MEIRRGQPSDLQPLERLLSRIENFTADEVACARELLELAVSAAPEEHVDYRLLVADRGEGPCAYVLYGPTPMTEGTWDLYWIASDPSVRGGGAGSRLLVAMETEVRRRGGGQVRIETSSMSEYAATRAFYDRHHYGEAARLPNFYKKGDDLVVLYKAL